MKQIFASILLSVTLLGSFAMAQLGGGAARVRISSPGMSCAKIQNTVQKYRAVIIYSKSHVYDRFVVSRNYCASGELAESGYVPSADKARCFAGYTCEYNDRGN